MLNYKFITNGDYQLYVRHIQPIKSNKKACLLFNSRSLCVESSMGISMGSISYGDYLACQGIDAFLIDLRGYGMSTSIQEQLYEDVEQITTPFTEDSFQSDIVASIEYVKTILGNDTEITLMGFSMAGYIIIDIAKMYPDSVQKIIILNTSGPLYPTDPRLASKFQSVLKTDKHYTVVSLNDIKNRLESAQPESKNFIEPLWFEEASYCLLKFHKTFNYTTNSWKLFKKNNFQWGDYSPRAVPIKAESLFITSQYDTENPLFIAERMYNSIDNDKKSLHILPDATHLCIWEKSRHILYTWSANFINGLEIKN